MSVSYFFYFSKRNGKNVRWKMDFYDSSFNSQKNVARVYFFYNFVFIFLKERKKCVEIQIFMIPINKHQ